MAVVQGIAEFLPISSSGHLAVLAAIFGFDADKSQTLGIMLHAGSLIAIVIFYWKVLVGFLKPEQWKLAGMLILATIPAGTVGMALEASGWAEKLFDNLMMTGLAFLITATLLRLSEKPKLIIRPAGEENFEPTPLDKVSWRQALAIGVGQMCAIIPGLSRSGTTITVGILSGVNREASGTFSFLLAIPVIGGAVFVHFLKLLKHPPAGSDVTFFQLGVGLAVSAVVSYFSLVVLTRLIKRGKLSVFSWYLYALGLGVILWQLSAMVRKGI
jgi:undecaprenyl-diphosphatase